MVPKPESFVNQATRPRKNFNSNEDGSDLGQTSDPTSFAHASPQFSAPALRVLHERLKNCNDELRLLNEQLEEHLTDEEAAEDYLSVSGYEGNAAATLSPLTYHIEKLQPEATADRGLTIPNGVATPGATSGGRSIGEASRPVAASFLLHFMVPKPESFVNQATRPRKNFNSNEDGSDLGQTSDPTSFAHASPQFSAPALRVLHERLKNCNDELRLLNEQLEEHLTDEEAAEDYLSVSGYEGNAAATLSPLTYHIEKLQPEATADRGLTIPNGVATPGATSGGRSIGEASRPVADSDQGDPNDIVVEHYKRQSSLQMPNETQSSVTELQQLLDHLRLEVEAREKSGQQETCVHDTSEGRRDRRPSATPTASVLHSASNKTTESNVSEALQQFCDLDSIGISDPSSNEDQENEVATSTVFTLRDNHNGSVCANEELQ
ncbi:hypothetical protein HPB52_022342 [Rhipicephalus sanguineus]|uniref:Uncharacterized protein n=1 Tax=Rhipicephalus sanguineus TaxID=34632 RepID=A0A9D4T0T0_RHISA|nr:hypothetical protein HPB52_022342 [Rhipicephalus sanguineus]